METFFVVLVLASCSCCLNSSLQCNHLVAPILLPSTPHEFLVLILCTNGALPTDPYFCSTSPKKLADIRGHDIFADGERAPAGKVSKKKEEELAGCMLKDIKTEPSQPPSTRMNTAKARKMDNLLSVAFSSGKVELPVAHVSSLKKIHLAGNNPIPWNEPVKLRCVQTTLLHAQMSNIRHTV
jgi:hypothetical protein